MNSLDLWKNRFRFGTASTLIAALGIISSPSLIAQDAETDEEGLEEVVVTGSRIKRTGFDTTTPAIIVDSELIQNRGFTNVGDILNENPSFGVSLSNNTGTTGGNSVGQQFVNFFGLGAQRTLVVIDGKRFVGGASPGSASAGLQVDLNTIPTALVERVENITVGGAPIYGADAIAGTVNIILKDDFEGIELDTQYTISDEGDGETISSSLLLGGNFADDRGNAVISFQYTNVNGVLQSDRPDIFRGQTFTTNQSLVPGCTATRCFVEEDGNNIFIITRGGIPVLNPNTNPDGNGILNSAGQITQFGPNGDLIPFNLGTPRGGPFAIGGDGPSLLGFNSLQNEQERYNIVAKGDYQVTDNINAFAEIFIATSDSIEPQNQPFINAANFGFDRNQIPFAINNPFLNAQARGVLNNALDSDGDGIADQNLVDTDGDGVPDTSSFFLARFSSDILDLSPSVLETLTYSFRFGLEGDIELFGKEFGWDATYSFGRTESDASSTGTIDDNFFRALDAVRINEEQATLIANSDIGSFANGSLPQAGDITCRQILDLATNGLPTTNTPGGASAVLDEETLTNIANCQPLNLFGNGAPSDAAIAYVTGQFTNESELQQQIATFNFNGDIVSLPWLDAPIGFNIGYEHRRELGSFQPDAGLQFGIGRNAGVQGISGGFNTNEIYGEVNIPVITPELEIPFVKGFEIDAAFRYIDNSSSGGDEVYTVGGRLQSVAGFTFRGNYTRSVRSPSISELFTPPSTTTTFANDPCDNRNIGNGPNPSVRRANCEAAFAAAEAANPGFDVNVSEAGVQTGLANFESIIVNQSQTGFNAGNPNLQSEIADSFTIGFVYEPEYVPGLSVTVDWVDIDITNAIVNIPLTQLLASCFDTTDFPNSSECQTFERGDNFQISSFTTGFGNAGFQDFSALIASVSYGFDLESVGLGDIGSVRLTGSYQYLDKLDISLSGTGEDLNPEAGEFDDPRHRATLNLNYDYGKFGFFWQSRFTSASQFNILETENARDRRFSKGQVFNNASLRYQITDNVQARLVVSNVFDKTPPQLAIASDGGGNNAELFDVLGRTFTFGIKANF